MSNVEEINYLKGRIEAQKQEIEKLRVKARHDEFANSVRSIYDSLLTQGFSADQAYELLVLTLKATFQLED